MKNGYDWEAHCQVMGLSQDEFYAVADSLGLPRRRFTGKQSEALLKALRKYAAEKDSGAIAQQSLF